MCHPGDRGGAGRAGGALTPSAASVRRAFAAARGPRRRRSLKDAAYELFLVGLLLGWWVLFGGRQHLLVDVSSASLLLAFVGAGLLVAARSLRAGGPPAPLDETDIHLIALGPFDTSAVVVVLQRSRLGWAAAIAGIVGLALAFEGAARNVGLGQMAASVVSFAMIGASIEASRCAIPRRQHLVRSLVWVAVTGLVAARSMPALTGATAADGLGQITLVATAGVLAGTCITLAGRAAAQRTDFGGMVDIARLVGAMRLAALTQDLRGVMLADRALRRRYVRHRLPRGHPRRGVTRALARRELVVIWSRGPARLASIAVAHGVTAVALVWATHGHEARALLALPCMLFSGLVASEGLCQDLDKPTLMSLAPVRPARLLLTGAAFAVVTCVVLTAPSAVGLAVAGHALLIPSLVASAVAGLAGVLWTLVLGPLSPTNLMLALMLAPEAALLTVALRAMVGPGVAAVAVAMTVGGRTAGSLAWSVAAVVIAVGWISLRAVLARIGAAEDGGAMFGIVLVAKRATRRTSSLLPRRAPLPVMRVMSPSDRRRQQRRRRRR